MGIVQIVVMYVLHAAHVHEPLGGGGRRVFIGQRQLLTYQGYAPRWLCLLLNWDRFARAGNGTSSPRLATEDKLTKLSCMQTSRGQFT